MTLIDPDLYITDLHAALAAEDDAGEAGELVGRDDSVERLTVAELKRQAA
jgi:hypothetical protein